VSCEESTGFSKDDNPVPPFVEVEDVVVAEDAARACRSGSVDVLPLVLPFVVLLPVLPSASVDPVALVACT
jgi:hypothetical protein